MTLDGRSARPDGLDMATLTRVPHRRLTVATLALLVIALAAVVSVASGAAGSIIYGTSDDRAMTFVFLPAPIVSLGGWAVLLVGYRALRTGHGADWAWVLAAALMLPLLGWFGAAFGLQLGDAINGAILQNTGSW
jgi:hypothetical protein